MLTVIVITKNEENMIKACLESVKWVDEIIVADNGSTDETLNIAKKYTDNIVKFEGQDFAGLRNKALEKASGDWVLYVDSDERVLEPLKEEIGKLMEENAKSAYAISRKNIIFGKAVSYGPYKKDWVIRLFKRSEFDKWEGKVHETPKFNGKLGYTKNSFLHLTHRDLDQIVLKSLSWSHIDAKLRLDVKHPTMSGWRFLRIFLTETFNQGVMRKGFFNGTVGVMDSMLQVFSMYMSYVRLWELQQTKSLDETYKDIDKKLLENGFKY
jgi:hypothetical protein